MSPCRSGDLKSYRIHSTCLVCSDEKAGFTWKLWAANGYWGTQETSHQTRISGCLASGVILGPVCQRTVKIHLRWISKVTIVERSSPFPKHCFLYSWWFQPIWKMIISQRGNLPQIGVKMKFKWNHHPALVCIPSKKSSAAYLSSHRPTAIG